MKLEDAIKILILVDHTPPSGASQRFKDAVKLGIEALKRVTTRRENLSWKFELLLPGETPE